MTLRAEQAVTLGSVRIQPVCEVTCRDARVAGSCWITGEKRPVALIIDDGRRRVVWRLPGSPSEEALVRRVKAELS